jgi:protein-tyrosine-phosphatase/predicted ATP-grasp superfamily ATP-dependent carboligase
MPQSSNPRPVLILGASPRIAVPIARLLQRRCGVPVDVAAVAPSDDRLRSRSVRNFFYLPDHLSQPEAFTKALVSAIEERGYDMLIPVQDSAMAAVAKNYDVLSGLLHVACPAPHVAQRVLEKDFTLKIAEQCDIPIPRSYKISSAADLQDLHPAPLFPAVVKPVERKGASSFKARYFRNADELISFLKLNTYGELLLQEYCPGVGVGIEMLIHKGECLASFQHRRLKEDPPSGGVAVMAISEETDPVLAEASYKLLRALEWEGVAMVEFRRNPVDGRAALMEINGRYWGTTSLPLQAGVEFPVYEWRLAHGEDPQLPTDYIKRLRWRWTAGYLERLHRILIGFRGGIEARESRMHALTGLAHDFTPSIRDAVFCFSDPLPAIAESSLLLARLVRNDLRTVLRKFVPRRLRLFLERYERLRRKARPIYLRLQVMDSLAKSSAAVKRTVPVHARSFVTVCFGNIMRSPMAGLMLNNALAIRGIENAQVISAGLHARMGREAHPWALEASRELGLPLDNHLAQPLTPEMVAQADAILAMDFENLAELLSLYPQYAGKMFMLSAYATGAQKYREIPDPYFGDLQETRRIYGILQACVDNLAASLGTGSTAGNTELNRIRPSVEQSGITVSGDKNAQ